VRPESIAVHAARPSGDNVFEAQVHDEICRGPLDQLRLRLDGGLELTALHPTRNFPLRGQRVFCQIQPQDLVLIEG
jgi:hypothetical protein